MGFSGAATAQSDSAKRLGGAEVSRRYLGIPSRPEGLPMIECLYNTQRECAKKFWIVFEKAVDIFGKIGYIITCPCQGGLAEQMAA